MSVKRVEVLPVLITIMVTSSTLATGAPGPTFRLASYYGDHMVLQMEPLQSSIWGYGEQDAQITLTLKEKVYTTKTFQGPDNDWIWKVNLDIMPPSGPFDIQIKHLNSKNTTEVIILQDVLFGDVWVCSGQSNMEFTVFQTINASEEMMIASQYPNIRLFTADKVESEKALYDLQSIMEYWSLPSPKTVANNSFTYFSAVCWFYGRNLYDHFEYPIGLIDTSWGGTPVEAWSSRDALAKCNISSAGNDVFKTEYGIEKKKVDGPGEDSVLWNAMVHPLLNMTIKGAIWYQGEANTKESRRNTYNCSFPAMIDDWRKKFHDASGGLTQKLFPFGFVQLSSNTPDPTVVGGFPVVRWHQTADYGYVPNEKLPNVFMAVAVDLGDPLSPWGPIHPRFKQDVGYRLALAGRAIAYNEEYVKYAGPFPTNVTVQEKDNTISIIFDNKKTQIRIQNDQGFEVCCSKDDNCTSQSLDWHVAPVTKALSTTGIEISTKQCAGQQLQALRYEWRESPCTFKNCSVYSVENNLPAPPFVMPIDKIINN
ncbi:sialate O-acetylesterase-like [Ptychodera flava]|uniref:sialate O-acetylesterase-like n=1 Tax=Ptychodera flava TaxID=63121 RepID=UPI00396A645A